MTEGVAVPALSGQSRGERNEPLGVPGEVAAAALAAFSSRDREAVLAELVSDSADGDGAGRNTTERTLVFSGGGFEVTLVLFQDAAEPFWGAQLIVSPPPDSDPQLDVRGRDVPTAVEAAPGRWSLAPLTPGPLRIVLTGQGRRVQTEWMLC